MLMKQGVPFSDWFFIFLFFRLGGFAFLFVLFALGQVIALAGRPAADFFTSAQDVESISGLIGTMAIGVKEVIENILSWVNLYFLFATPLCLLIARVDFPLSIRALIVAFFGVLGFAIGFIFYNSFIISCLLLLSFFIMACISAVYELFRQESPAEFVRHTLDICLKFVQVSLIVFSIGIGLLRFVSLDREVGGDGLLAVLLFVGVGYFFHITLFAILVVVPFWLMYKDASLKEAARSQSDS